MQAVQPYPPLVMEPFSPSTELPPVPTAQEAEKSLIELLKEVRIKPLLLASFPFPSSLEVFRDMIEPMTDQEADDFFALLIDCQKEVTTEWWLLELARAVGAVSAPFRCGVAQVWIAKWKESSFFSRLYQEAVRYYKEEAIRRLKEHLHASSFKDVEKGALFARELLDQLLQLNPEKIEKATDLTQEEVQAIVFHTCQLLVNYYTYGYTLQAGLFTLTLTKRPEEARLNRFSSGYQALSSIKQQVLAFRLNQYAMKQFVSSPTDLKALSCYMRSLSLAKRRLSPEIILEEFPFPASVSLVSDAMGRASHCFIDDQEAYSEEKMLAFVRLLFDERYFSLGEKPFCQLVQDASTVPFELREPFVQEWVKSFEEALRGQGVEGFLFYPSFPSRDALVERLLQKELKQPFFKNVWGCFLKGERDVELKGVSYEDVDAFFGCFKAKGLIGHYRIEQADGSFFVTFYLGEHFQTLHERNLLELDLLLDKLSPLKKELWAWLSFEVNRSLTILTEDEPLRLHTGLSVNCARFCLGHTITEILLAYFPYPRRSQEMEELLKPLSEEERVALLREMQLERLPEEDYFRAAKEAIEHSKEEREAFLKLEVPLLLFPFRRHLGEFRRIVSALPEKERASFAELFARKDFSFEEETVLEVAIKVRKLEKKERLPYLKTARFMVVFEPKECQEDLACCLKGMTILGMESCCQLLRSLSLSKEALKILLTEAAKTPPSMRLEFLKRAITDKSNRYNDLFCSLVEEKIEQPLPERVVLARRESVQGGTHRISTFVKPGIEVARSLIRKVVEEEIVISLSDFGVERDFLNEYRSPELLLLMRKLQEVGLIASYEFREQTLFISRDAVIQEEEDILQKDLTWAVQCGFDSKESALLGLAPNSRSRAHALAVMVRLPKEKRIGAVMDLYFSVQGRLTGDFSMLLEELLDRLDEEEFARIKELLNSPHLKECADLILPALSEVQNDAVDGFLHMLVQAKTREKVAELISLLREGKFWKDYWEKEKASALIQSIRKGRLIAESKLVDLAKLRCEEDLIQLFTHLQIKGFITGYSIEEGFYRFTVPDPSRPDETGGTLVAASPSRGSP